MHRLRFAVALCFAATQGIALAQAATPPTAPAATADEPEVITVTAQRREQDLQEVPVSVTALQADVLENLQIQNFNEIGYQIPNLATNVQIGAATTPAFAIRGVNSGLLTFSVDSGVALYLDGVYVARSAGSAFDLADLERVEVLRGPQGVLWGKNTTAGAINFVTGEPDEEAGGRLSVGFGEFDQRKFRATLNTGEHDGFSARLSYTHNQSDGYIDNLAAGRDIDFRHGFGVRRSVSKLGAENTDALFLALHFESEKFRGDYKFDYTNLVATQQGTQAIGLTPDPGTAGFVSLVLSLQPGIGGTNILDPKRRSKLANDMMTPDLLSVKGHSLALEYDLTDTIQLRSLTGLRSLAEITGGNDIDGNALRDPLGFFGGAPGDTFTFISSIQDREQKQFSEELQILGEHGPIEWLAGIYFFRETGDDKNPVWIFQDFPGDVALPGLFPPPVSNHADVTNKSKALFAHATYHALENLYVSVGLRQTWDDRKMFDRVIPGRDVKGSFDSFDWSIKLGFDPIEDVNLYASVVTGYLSGGFLNGAPFKEEDVISYEIGAKTRWLDRRLTLNGDVFFMDYEDLQLPVFTGFLSLFNAGKAEIFGAELEANLELVEGVNLNLGWGYQDFEYKELRFGVGAPDVSSTAQRTNTPPHTLNLGAGYTAPERTFGTLSFGFDASWRDDVKFLLFAHPDPVTNRAATQNAHWQLAARAALSEIPLGGITGKENMRGKISIWALNLTNEDEIQFASDLGSVVVGKFMKPRTFGIDFTLDF